MHDLVFCLFGVHWLIWKKLVELLSVGRRALLTIILLMYGEPCLIVLCGPFGGREIFGLLMGLSNRQLKLYLLPSMFDWLCALSRQSFSTLEETFILFNF